MLKQYKNFNELYLSTLDEVYNHYEFENSPRGFSEREILGFSCKIQDPTARFCLHPQRRQNIIFNYAEALWYLSGKNDLEFISWYAPSMARYSADGKTLPGTGYGNKLLNFGQENLNQIRRAIDVLKNDDTDSKRVYLQIFNADEDIYKHNIDVSCTLGLQLLLREGKLHMVAFMRANDAFVGMLSDIFSFTFIQEFIATMLDCEVGTYTHNVGSIHIYENNLGRVEGLLNNLSSTLKPEFLSPKIPSGSDMNTITTMLKYENLIRHSSLSLSEINQLPIAEYWIDILRMFLIHKYEREKLPVPADLIDAIHPFHRMFVLNKQLANNQVELT